jgi:hypothetical protein
MEMKRISTALIAGVVVALAASAALAGVTPAVAPKVSKAVSVVIRHQVHGCHTWSLADGAFKAGAFKAAQVGRIARGGTITIVNNDVMPQKFFKKTGPAVRFSGNPAMNHVGAAVKVTFLKAGVYTFATTAGEDYSYAKNAATTGEDNNLTLKIVVS